MNHILGIANAVTTNTQNVIL